MTIRYKLPILHIIWLGTVIGLFWLTSEMLPSYIYLIFIVPVLLFLLVSDRLAFFFFVMLILVTAFSFLYMAFINDWTPYKQVFGITVHILLLLHLFSLFSLSKYVFYLQTDNHELKKRLKDLEEYVVDDHVLSRREFDKQAEIIMTSMIRKNEYGYIVKIGVSRMNKHIAKGAMISLAVITYDTLRKNFDLIGQYDEKTIIFLLQDTHEKGLEIVIKRIKSAFITKFEPEILDQIDWEVIKLSTKKEME